MATQYPLHHIAFIHAFIQKLSAFFALNSNPFFAKPTANLSPSLPPFIALLASALRTSHAFHQCPTKLDSVSLDSDLQQNNKSVSENDQMNDTAGVSEGTLAYTKWRWQRE